MISETSINAYKVITESGLLRGLQYDVYEYIHLCVTTTQPRAVRHFQDMKSSIVPRFAELERMGVIEKIGEVRNEETGMPVDEWSITGRLPIRRSRVKPPTRGQLEIKNKVLQEENARLAERVAQLEVQANDQDYQLKLM